MKDAILVFCQNTRLSGLITRMLRWREIRCIPMPFDTPACEMEALEPRGVIVAAEESLEDFDWNWFSGAVPVLALGAAAAELCAHLDGRSALMEQERSFADLELTSSPLFEEIDSGERMLPGLYSLDLPTSLSPIASAEGQVIGFAHNALPLYGMQYPIERNDPDASQLLSNFAARICLAAPVWTEEVLIDHAVEIIRRSAPEGRVLCAVSGGVDSAVCARLAHMAVGDRLTCVFVDTGMFRENEPETVIRTYLESLELSVAHVAAHEPFLRALSGVNNALDKERIASQLMDQMLIRQLADDPDIQTVITGTNLNDALFAPPRTETSDGKVRVCEPIRELYKEEVRRLGKALNLPASIIDRQPFPASGLALRIMGSVTEERLSLLRRADAIFACEICEGGLDRRMRQFYATLIESPDQPEGYAVCLRATQVGAEGAYAARIPFDVLERAAESIRKEMPAITRIVYDLTPSAHYGELE